jgi:4-hydroxy-2-oxoheptanedioate aldolase
MTPNRLRALWAEGRPVVNGWISLGSAQAAEFYAGCGWDAVTIDQQHGLIGYETLLAIQQAIARVPEVTPLVRVPWNSPGDIMKALDAGAMGIICPMISSRAECEAFVQACRYPPDGYRSFGPTRAAALYGADYPSEANGQVLTLAMIETKGGLENVEEIAATPGLDGIYIGPSDLSLGALGGKPDQDSQDPVRLAAFDRILSACKAAGRRTGVHTQSVGYSKQMIARGFDLVTVGSDLRYLMAGARREVREMREP